MMNRLGWVLFEEQRGKLAVAELQSKIVTFESEARDFRKGPSVPHRSKGKIVTFRHCDVKLPAIAGRQGDWGKRGSLKPFF